MNVGRFDWVGETLISTGVAGMDGQDHWYEHYPYCGGAFQSPIDINSDLLKFDPNLRPVEVHNYNLSPNEQLTLGNNGHSGKSVSSC